MREYGTDLEAMEFAPHVTYYNSYYQVEVCSSLILSILKQVLDDKDESVRECSVKNLALLITRIYNSHKSSDVSFTILQAGCAS